ncbi:MAG: hypothetical protein L0Y66_11195 [Myxococcaceae bacterium]|nr:hypothetical protein [Myxococcaceae bacterium]MCI0672429.1 hypothetical protein [Myxococcaceae bacterium]
MTAGTSIEAKVAASARAWRGASSSDDAAVRAAAERELADQLELWIASLLATDENWPLGGRWFDGLILLECSASEGERFDMRGYIYRIDTQEQYPFRTMIQLSTDGLAGFDVRFGDGTPATKPRRRNPQDWVRLRFEPDWGFQFVRSN